MGKQLITNTICLFSQRQGTIDDTPGDNAVDSPESSQKPSSASTRDAEEKNCDAVSGKISSRKNQVQKEIGETGAGGAVGQQILEYNKMTQSSSLPPPEPHPVDMISERTTDLKREVLVSEAEKNSLETKPGSSVLEEPSKPCRPVPHTFSVYSRPKMVVSIGKSSSSSATEKSPKPSSTSRNSIPPSKQQPSDGDENANTNDEDCVSSDAIRERDGDDEKSLKEHTKSMQQSRASHSSVSKTRDSSASLKASPAARLNGGSSEASGKHSLSGTFQKNDPMQSITDEEVRERCCYPFAFFFYLSSSLGFDICFINDQLALRLHHQLNSSPRVPRVPRMRQPGSLALSPTATSFKRTCSSGSKDHTTV